MLKAIIKNNIVINTILAAPDYTPESDYLMVDLGENAQGVGIGWGYENDAFIDPQTLKTVDEVRSERIVEVSALRDQKYADGMIYQGKTYQIDSEAQKDMTAIMTQFALGNTNPHGGVWRTVDNEAVSMDDAQVQTFIQAAFSYVLGVKNTAWVHKENLNSLIEKQDVLEYNIDIGWPT